MKRIFSKAFILSALFLFWLSLISLTFSCFAQEQNKADLLIFFSGWENIQVKEPVESKDPEYLDKQGLKRILDSLVSPSGFLHLAFRGTDVAIVVVADEYIEKGIQKGFRQDMRALVKEYGFDKVRFVREDGKSFAME